MRYDLVVFDFEDTLADSASRVFPGAPEFLRDLTEAGLTLAILGTCGETSVRRALGEAQHLVDAYACEASPCGIADKLRQIAGRMASPPERMLFVGDDVPGIEAAGAAGVPSAAVTWGRSTRAMLASAAPALVADSFDDLARRITGLPFLRLVR